MPKYDCVEERHVQQSWTVNTSDEADFAAFVAWSKAELETSVHEGGIVGSVAHGKQARYFRNGDTIVRLDTFTKDKSFEVFERDYFRHNYREIDHA